MHIKIHKSYRNVVAICDESLLGKKFEEGKRQLDLTTQFYQGDAFTKEEALKLIESQSREDATFNIIGKESTETAIEAGIISKENIDSISEIPFALTLL